MQVKRASHAEHHHQMNSITNKGETFSVKKGWDKAGTDQSLDSLLNVISDSVSEDSGFEISEDDFQAPPDFRKMQNSGDPEKAERKGGRHHRGGGHCGDADEGGPEAHNCGLSGGEPAGKSGQIAPKPEVTAKIKDFINSKSETADSESTDELMDQIVSLLQQLLDVLEKIKEAKKAEDKAAAANNPDKEKAKDLFEQLFALLPDDGEDDEDNDKLKELLKELQPMVQKHEKHTAENSEKVVS
jgi:hypothetical protein